MGSQLALLGGQKLRVGLGEIQEKGHQSFMTPKLGVREKEALGMIPQSLAWVMR